MISINAQILKDIYKNDKTNIDRIISEKKRKLYNVLNPSFPILRQNFTMISSKGDFVNDWNEQCDIITFIK